MFSISQSGSRGGVHAVVIDPDVGAVSALTRSRADRRAMARRARRSPRGDP